MNTKIIEIRTEEDAAKWIGRKVRLGFKHNARDPHFSEESGQLQGCERDSDGDLKVWTNNDYWYVIPASREIVVIELLDGAAHPRPEGDGWVWCETTEQAISRFEGVGVEACIAGVGHPVALDAAFDNLNRSRYWRGWLITDRRGAWIRPIPETPAPAAKTPEREAAEGLELRAVTLDDRASEASAAAAACRAELRVARKIASESEERSAGDACYPLPEDWRWGPSKRGRGFAAFDDGTYECCVRYDGEIELYDHECDVDSYAYAPFAVIQAVNNRNAERAK